MVRKIGMQAISGMEGMTNFVSEMASGLMLETDVILFISTCLFPIRMFVFRLQVNWVKSVV